MVLSHIRELTVVSRIRMLYYGTIVTILIILDKKLNIRTSMRIWEKRMNKKIIIGSIIAVAILVVMSSSSAIYVNISGDNHPPDKPKITGPVMIHTPGPHEYTFKAIDLDGDDVSYQIDWRDGDISDWTDFYESGEEIIRNHIFSEQGVFQIKARAKDIHGAIGEWSELQLSVSQSSQRFTTLGVVDVLINNEMLGNRPPYVPKNPIPENGETDVPIDEIFISWTGGDPDEDPWSFNVKYDVYFGESSPPPLVVEKQISLRYDPGIMDMYTTYYWQIVATDPQGESTTGPVWNFTTDSRINRPPNAPEITAEEIADNLFLIKFKLTDPDGDNLKAFAVQWDKNLFGFIYKGNWPNGTVIEEIMGYGRGWHQITASCFDRWGKWGDDGYLVIEISRNQVSSTQQSTTPLLHRLLVRFPLLKGLLNPLIN